MIYLFIAIDWTGQTLGKVSLTHGSIYWFHVRTMITFKNEVDGQSLRNLGMILGR